MTARLRRSASALLLLFACAAPLRIDRPEDGLPIDLVPRYGDVDRSADPRLRAGDEDFIRGVVEEFGSREAASRRWSDYGMRLYLADDYERAMRRLNQAWLLDPENPESYWGFAAIYSDFRRYDLARRWMSEALDRGLAEAEGLADAALIFASGEPTKSEQQRSGELVERALVSMSAEEADYVESHCHKAFVLLEDPDGIEALFAAREAAGRSVSEEDRRAFEAWRSSLQLEARPGL